MINFTIASNAIRNLTKPIVYVFVSTNSTKVMIKIFEHIVNSLPVNDIQQDNCRFS